MSIQFAAFQGKSLISKAIRFQTRSKFSHIAIRFTEDLWVRMGEGREKMLKAGSIIEAWSGAVRLCDNISSSHTPGTHVDFFEYNFPLSQTEIQQFAGFLVEQLGKPYDYLSIIRFLTRERGNLDNKWFCSELAFQASVVVGYPLLRDTPAWKVPPAWIPMSPLLKFVSSEVTH